MEIHIRINIRTKDGLFDERDGTFSSVPSIGAFISFSEPKYSGRNFEVTRVDYFEDPDGIFSATITAEEN